MMGTRHAGENDPTQGMPLHKIAEVVDLLDAMKRAGEIVNCSILPVGYGSNKRPLIRLYVEEVRTYDAIGDNDEAFDKAERIRDKVRAVAGPDAIVFVYPANEEAA